MTRTVVRPPSVEEALADSDRVLESLRQALRDAHRQIQSSRRQLDESLVVLRRTHARVTSD